MKLSRGAPAESSHRQKPERKPDTAMAHVKTIGGAFLVAIFIRIVLFEAFEIEGPSMEPTLLHGDRVVVAKFMYGLFLPFAEQAAFTWNHPDVADVIILRSPERGVETVDIVKRVIGEPGDTIEIITIPISCGGGQWSERDVIIRNGERVPQEIVGPCQHRSSEETRIPGSHCNCTVIRETIDDESYLTSTTYRERSSLEPADPDASIQRIGPMTLDEDHIFVMGDHRDASNDSRNEMLGPVPLSRVKGLGLFIYWSNSPDSGFQGDRIGSGVD